MPDFSAHRRSKLAPRQPVVVAREPQPASKASPSIRHRLRAEVLAEKRK